jgi:phenylalanyl-tRNA synthetase alpha chain
MPGAANLPPPDMDELENLISEARGRIAIAADLAQLSQLESDLVGKGSLIASRRRALASLPPADRPAAGARINQVAAELNRLLGERRLVLERAESNRLLEAEWLDVTLAGYTMREGGAHLIHQTIEEVCEIFIGMGYQVADGPEAELGWYNFDALNTPPTHPSRFETDTLYLDYGDPRDEVLLRTHTSPMQTRWMESHEPPVYIVVPGKVYRNETTDASHLPVFHQIEGLAVDTGITMSDLKGTLAHFARRFFGPRQAIRLRPSFFPFTEPSAELDVSCFACEGGEPGCRVCKGSGWLEMVGCGMVDPNVYRAVGYDPGRITGFAFGGGVERLAMARHGIKDIRHFIDNDLRVLEQFR